MTIACFQSRGKVADLYDELKIIDTGIATDDASLDQKVDGIESGPELRECLALDKAANTTGMLKSTDSEGAHVACVGAVLV